MLSYQLEGHKQIEWERVRVNMAGGKEIGEGRKYY